MGLFAAAVDFVGRFESLGNDLVRALRAAGEPFDERALRATPPVNTSPIARDLARWTPDLSERVRRIEQRARERFGYLSM